MATFPSFGEMAEKTNCIFISRLHSFCISNLNILLISIRHIPKASGSTMKNIMNFCFNLKRAEKVYGQAVSLDLYT